MTTKIPTNQVMGILFDRAYQYFLSDNTLLSDILVHNSIHSPLINSFKISMNQQMQDIFYECIDFKNSDIPLDIIAGHFSNTFMLVLEKNFSQEEAQKYLDFLLGPLL